ncbi:MAG: beta-propeller domain-containing protein [Deltaproteobacteria bacterium]|jgi:hypothetical protein|nr:beta-propeller domain-containing protein [Deltaproteobacteria bacterium]MBW2530732.1 beta-propeller domain-containing protein [Deltaproteobacteria bacterium]
MSHVHRLGSLLLTTAAVAAMNVALIGCGGSDSGDGEEFISDDPNRAADPGDAQGTGTGTDNGTGTDAGAGGSGGGDFGEEAPEDPERLIEEADIIQMDGDLLYALSEYSGLAIIDAADPARLRLLGREPLPGRPFEMYLRDGVVYAMFSGWGHYVESGQGWEWVQTSHLEALDVSDPTDIATIGAFDMPGSLADSRMVGDVLYVVTFEDGYCYQCRQEPNTTVTSVAVADPEGFAVIDSLTFGDDYGSWRRSISVTTDRMYVGGTDWSDGMGSGSTIQVVDISDPTGDLVLGAEVVVAGQIDNRWQMDEFDGVLRVVSQPWDTTVYPRVQTFQVLSSQQLTPLGETELTLPQPESLRSVRFDEYRAYAITAEVIVGDPLYTIDLSDPANPQQRGELEIPGWVYHIEPRGDRLLTLGFDQDDPAGSLHVSLFDVSDMTNPVMLRRIPFGGDWSNFAEDQDRIHKAFKILPTLGLIMVPFSAWESDANGCGQYHSGIQLVDWANDDLIKRGVAPIRGQARRAFMHRDRLFAMSDEQIRTFDISNRDQPSTSGELQLSAHVSEVIVAGDYVVRLAADWWTAEPRIEVVPSAAPTGFDALGALDLGPMLADAEQNDSCYYWSYWDVRMFSFGSHVYLVWPSWNNSTARVAAIDISDPANPRLGAHLDVPVDVHSYHGYYWSYAPQLVATGDPVAQIGSTLVFLSVDLPESEYDYGYPSYVPTRGSIHQASLAAVDLSDVDAPRIASRVALPPGGGHTGLVARGSQVLLSHWTPVPAMPGKAKFYLDRIDFSNVNLPLLQPSINVPGSLVAFDAPSANLLTVDYQREVLENVTSEECYDTFAYGYGTDFEPYDPEWWELGGSYADVLGRCTRMHRSFRLVHVDEAASGASSLDHVPLPDDLYLSRLLVGDDRVFTTSHNYYGYDGSSPQSLAWVIGGLRAGRLQLRTEPLDSGAYYSWWRPLEADGQRFIALTWSDGITSVDASNLDDLVIERHEVLPWSVYDAEIDGDRALVSLGAYGLQEVSLAPTR